jgi:hypothetical protein
MANLFIITLMRAHVWARIAMPTRKPACGLSLPRRARRGAFLLATGLGLILWVGVLSYWASHLAYQERLSRAEGLAASISQLGADFDFYVHNNAAGLTTELNTAGTSAVALSATRLTDFTTNSWRFRPLGLAAAPTNWSISLDGIDIAMGVAREELGALPVGVLLLGTQTGEADALIDDIRVALAARSAQTDRDVLNAPDESGAIIIGAALSTGQSTFTTPAMSGLHPDLILRELRAGHELNNVLSAPLSFDAAASTRNLTNAGQLGVENAQVSGCTAALSRCTTASQTHVVDDQSLTALVASGTLSVFEAGSLGSANVLGAASVNTLGVTGAMNASGSVTAASAAELTNGSYDSMVVTQMFGSDQTGAGNQTTVLNAANATTLTTTDLETVNTRIGLGASQTPAFVTPLLVSKNASFGTVLTQGCSGC